MKSTQAPVKKKQSYEKPILRVVKIAEGHQTLNIGCKLRTGQSAKGATPCFPGNYCASAGS